MPPTGCPGTTTSIWIPNSDLACPRSAVRWKALIKRKPLILEDQRFLIEKELRQSIEQALVAHRIPEPTKLSSLWAHSRKGEVIEANIWIEPDTKIQNNSDNPISRDIPGPIARLTRGCGC